MDRDIELAHTVEGLFRDNTIIMPSGEVISCIPYSCLRSAISRQYGWFNIRFDKEIKSWVVYDYVIR